MVQFKTLLLPLLGSCGTVSSCGGICSDLLFLGVGSSAGVGFVRLFLRFFHDFVGGAICPGALFPSRPFQLVFLGVGDGSTAKVQARHDNVIVSVALLRELSGIANCKTVNFVRAPGQRLFEWRRGTIAS